MRFLISTLLTALFAYALGLFFDWWSVALAAGIVSVCIHQRPLPSFFSGFLGILLLWGGYSLWLNDNNGGMLAARVTPLLSLGSNVVLLIVLTALIGALTGGFAALTGSYIWPQPSPKRNSRVKSQLREKQQPAAETVA